MGTGTNIKKQTKRELKARKEAARAAARAAERRRTRITAAVVGVIVLVGVGLVLFTIDQERRIAAEEQRLAEERASEAAAEQAELTEMVENRPVACDGEVPPGAEAEPPTFEEPADVLTEGADYRAVIETSCGRIVVDLAEDAAPATVNSFAFLAQEGFFDGLEIFRNDPRLGVLQTGSGTNSPAYQVGYTIPDELDLAQEEGYPPGTLAMANAGPDSGGSQFFFVYSESFDEQFADQRAYTRFGTVVEGMDVLTRMGELGMLEEAAALGQLPAEKLFLESVAVESDTE